MDAARLAGEFDRLGAAAAERAEEAFRREVQGVLGELGAELRRLLEAARQQGSLVAAAGSPRAAAAPFVLPQQPPASVKVTAVSRQPPSHFTAALLKPTTPVRVGEDTLHVHRAVLEGIPYFDALLAGEWCDAAKPEVMLPCSVEEFSLLMQRRYTGELLGSAGLPVEGFSSVLRVAETAAMLLIDDQLPELPHLLSASIASAEDADAAKLASERLPVSLGGALRVLGTGAVPGEKLAAAAASATTPPARAAAATLLSAYRGRVEGDALAEVAKGVLQSSDSASVEWAARLAREHLDCARATDVFRCSAPAEIHDISCHQYGSHRGYADALQSAYLVHLRRCAGTGHLAEALLLGVEGTRELPAPTSHTSRFDLPCTIRHADPLILAAAGSTDLAAALASAGREREAAAEMMRKMPPAQIVEVLTEDVLVALGPYAATIVERLAEDLDKAFRWVRPRLAISTSRVASAEVLRRATPRLLAEVLTEEVVAALGPCAAPVLARLAEAPAEAAEWLTLPRLAALHGSAQVAVCTGLLSCLDELDEEVLAEVVRVLS